MYIFCRSMQFQPSSALTHGKDLEEIANIAQAQGKSVMSLIVDGGPDWSLKSLTTFLAMGRLWRKQSLDALLVMTYAPGQSKFNPIERQWAPRSRDLSGLVLPACLPGEDKPPPQQSGLSEEQRMQKQKAVHKAAISRLCSIWNGRTYDGHPVAALAVEHPNDDGLDSGLDKEHQKIDEVAEAGVKRIRDDESLRPVLEEVRFLTRHANRSHHVLSFLKCCEKTCQHCCERPVQAVAAVCELRMFHGRTPSPGKLNSALKHYRSYLECLMQPERNPAADEGLPSAGAKEIERCPDGCRYVFRSKADRAKHELLMHPNQRLARMQQARQEKKAKAADDQGVDTFICHSVVNGKECGLVFSSRHYLQKHQKQAGHKVSRGRRRV